MKRIIFPFLGMFMLVLSSCIKTGDSYQTFQEVPAIVGLSNTFQPLLITQWETFIAPDLQDKIFNEIMEGDLLLIWFTVNYNKQPSAAEHVVVSDLQYIKIGRGSPYATPGGESMTGDYNTPIEEMYMFNRFNKVGDYLLFVFGHTALIDQKFTYEMTYDPDNQNDIKVLYLRAKKVGEGSKTESSFLYPFAFNMSYFFNENKGANNMVKISFKFKGVDSEGNHKDKDYFDPYDGRSIFEFPVE